MIRLWMQEQLRADASDPQVSGRWVGLGDWPPADGTGRSFVLNPGRLDAEAEAETRLDFRSPLTCGLAGGEWCPRDAGGDGPEFQLDQREDDGRSLCFDSAPLTERLEVLGTAKLTVELSADQPAALLAARLCEVAPDGSSTRVTFALLNLCHRDGHADPQPLTPGERVRIVLPLKVTGYSFSPGHRIRLALSTVYWPMAWPSPRPVTLSVYTGASALFLPLCDAAQVVEPIEAFEPAECAPPLATTVLEPGEPRRTVTRDLGRGTVTLTHLDDGGLERLDGIGLDLRRVAREEFTIVEDDPLSARTTMTRSFEIRRGPWRARTSERLEVSCDAEAFKVTASLEAFDGDERIFARDWDERVPRDHM